MQYTKRERKGMRLDKEWDFKIQIKNKKIKNSKCQREKKSHKQIKHVLTYYQSGGW